MPRSLFSAEFGGREVYLAILFMTVMSSSFKEFSPLGFLAQRGLIAMRHRTHPLCITLFVTVLGFSFITVLVARTFFCQFVLFFPPTPTNPFLFRPQFWWGGREGHFAVLFATVMSSGFGEINLSVAKNRLLLLLARGRGDLLSWWLYLINPHHPNGYIGLSAHFLDWSR